MSGADKARNMAENLKGKAKEATGRLTGDEKQQAEGKTEQTKADAKQTGEKAKDTLDLDD